MKRPLVRLVPLGAALVAGMLATHSALAQEPTTQERVAALKASALACTGGNEYTLLTAATDTGTMVLNRLRRLIIFDISVSMYDRYRQH